ncbi:hypothetical protein UFOVP496_10 [uncultured Caudovirales phage]|uniref:Uncharacterized protein n=1 Tax=uncultured Caudovirales phage TaxID=2100421 RepID=A0A6J5MKH0_9CAUD|nr:hypothetical protein UFOVP496_10 [uncultured Caudovirales phage]
MSIESVAASLTVIATIISTTVLVISKISHVEVLLAELRMQVSAFEARISRLEKNKDIS